MNTTKERERGLKRIERELRAVLIALKPEIRDEYRASDDPADTTPAMAITIGVSADCQSWSYQTGDNSFAGGAYGFPYWGIGTLTRRCNTRALAREIVNDAADQMEWE